MSSLCGDILISDMFPFFSSSFFFFSFFLSQTPQVRTAQLEHRKINKLLLPHRYTLVVLTVIL